METLTQAIEPGVMRVLAARRYFCAHGWNNILCPCSECRAEFDAGMWDAPSTGQIADIFFEPHFVEARTVPRQPMLFGRRVR